MKKLFGDLGGKSIPRWKVLERLIKTYDLKIIAEIGIFHGDLALNLLNNVQIDEYLMVDIIYRSKVESILSKYRYAKMFIMKSIDAAKFIPDSYLDLVFIDADHKAESVKEDLKAWIPKVKIGGWITGHDYSTTLPPPYPGLNEVVDSILPDREIIPENLDVNYQRSCFIKQKDGNEKL